MSASVITVMIKETLNGSLNFSETDLSNKNFEYIVLYYFTGSTRRVFWSILLYFLVNNFTFSKTCKIVEEGKGFQSRNHTTSAKGLLKGRFKSEKVSIYGKT